MDEGTNHLLEALLDDVETYLIFLIPVVLAAWLLVWALRRWPQKPWVRYATFTGFVSVFGAPMKLPFLWGDSYMMLPNWMAIGSGIATSYRDVWWSVGSTIVTAIVAYLIAWWIFRRACRQ